MENTVNTDNNQTPLEATLAAHRTKWTEDIKEINDKLKSLVKTDELLNEIYSKRQSCVDYYYSMNGVILKHSKAYKKLYNDMFNNIKINGYNGIRFSSDQSIARQVEVDLQDNKEVIDLLTNQNSFIKETIATLDNIIYGINQKVKIHELLNGLKF